MYTPPDPARDRFRPPRRGSDPFAWFVLFTILAGLALIALTIAASGCSAPTGSPQRPSVVPVTQIGDGAWRVRDDVPALPGDITAGMWRSADLTPGTCRWWTTDPGDGRIIVRPLDSAIDDLVPAQVRLYAGTDFHTAGCGDWRLVP